MTTFFQFVPSLKRAPAFMPTFDGAQYSVTVVWNISARRFYVNCKDLSGNLIFMVPLIINPDPIELVSISYDPQNHRVVAQTIIPHGFPIGSVVNGNIVGCVPNGYNGSGLMSILSKTEIIYPMLNNPGQPALLGVFDYLISMTKGYFISTLVYRNGNFEVSP